MDPTESGSRSRQSDANERVIAGYPRGRGGTEAASAAAARSAREPMGVAVDLAIFTVQEQRLELLLIRMKREPFTGKWALPGGRIRGNETVEAAAERELREKTGLRDVYLEQLYTFSEPFRDPEARCISVGHMALIRGDVQLSTTDKYTGIGWFPMTKLPPLAFDHERIAKYGESFGCDFCQQGLFVFEVTIGSSYADSSEVGRVTQGKALDAVFVDK